MNGPHAPVGTGARFVRAVAFIAMAAAPIQAQVTPPAPAPTPGRVRGRVVSDSGSVPVAGADVLIPALDRTARTDSLGRYDFPNLASGNVMVLVRALGYRAESTTVEVRERRVISLELRLAFDDIVITRAGTVVNLPPITKVEVPDPNAADPAAKMKEFFVRKQLGVGRFLERADVAKWSARRTAEMLDALAGGLKVENGGMQAFATNGRLPASACTLCRVAVADTLDPVVLTSVARQSCYMDVFVDGVVAYRAGMEPPEPLFDLNGIAPDGIEAVEVYLVAAQVPVKFTNRIGTGCGVIVIWTRLSADKKP